MLLMGLVACGNAGDAETCGNIDPSVQRKCVGTRIDAKVAKMEVLFVRARAEVAKSFAAYGRHDNRTDPRRLDAAQSAWRSFAEAHCDVVAAYGGGSNSAISDRATECFEDELDRRTEFLRQLAEKDGIFAP